ncbi:MAG: hypothetical protein WC307_05595 [Candidatus Nanoarchaeia archaeon]|jgi:transcription initiation factor TFIIIB Brf1 subunit/transcription initiation factor TFIIB
MPEWLSYDPLRRGLNPAIVILNKASGELNLPDHVNNYSIRLYEMLLAKKLTVGRKRESLIGACVYISCLGVNYPINIDKLCKSLEIEKKELIRQKKFIKKFVVTNEQGITIESYINKYSYQLSLEQEEVTQSIRISKIISQRLINRKIPIISAVSIYLVMRNKVSIRDLARLTGLSRSGIYEAYKEVKDTIPSVDLLTSNQGIYFIKKN